MTKIKRILILGICVSLLYFIVNILTTDNVAKQGLTPNKEAKELDPIFREDVGHKQRNLQVHKDWNSALVHTNKILIPYKMVHLDLKGAPVRLSYYEKLFPQIKQAGGNSLLLEYEDMFPFTQYAHKNAYSQGEIKRILELAKQNDLEVIPLIQTFGHLEFVLKLEKFAHLREVPEFPQEVCPSRNASFHLITNMIDQVMRLHEGANYVHIGCDEVYHLGMCDKCKTKDVKSLFVDHVMRVSKYVKDKYKVRPIIWDDMLRKFYTEDILKSAIGNEVDLMVWDYTEEVDHLVNPYLWPMYTSVFPNIWVASAFKGAFGESLFQVQFQRHALNHLSWLKVLGRESHRIKNFRGMAITGWSRYDHFSVLCELLPVALPSLLLSLFLLQFGQMKDSVDQLGKVLKCDVSESFLRLDDCQWDGKDLYDAVAQLAFLGEQTGELVEEQRKVKGWLSSYQISKNYTSPWRLQEALQQGLQYVESVKAFQLMIKSTLSRYYEDYVVREWLESRVLPLLQQLNSLIHDIRNVSKRRFWPKRPLL